MKADKKLKQIVKRNEKSKLDYSFRRNVFDTYSQKKEEKVIPLYKKSWFRAALSTAACAAVAFTIFVGVNHKAPVTPDNQGVVVIENYVSSEVAFNKEREAINKTDESGITYNYLDKVIDLTGCSVLEDCIYRNEQNGMNEYRYVNGSKGDDIFQIQLVLNGNFEYKSQLSDTVKNVTINGVDFDYCVYYAKNDKMYYVVGESKSADGALLVGLVTTKQNYDENFKNFLLAVIK